MPTNKSSYSRAYYLKNRERLKPYFKKYYVEHKEQLCAYSMKEYAKVRGTRAYLDRRNEYMKAYYKRPYAAKKRRAYEREYKARPPFKTSFVFPAPAKKRG